MGMAVTGLFSSVELFVIVTTDGGHSVSSAKFVRYDTFVDEFHRVGTII